LEGEEEKNVMSVFIRKDSSDGIYSYEFQYRNKRFSGSTGKASRREAKQIEAAKLAEAKALYATSAQLYAKEMSIETACARYWQEKAQYEVNAKTKLASLDWICAHFGNGTMLHDIDDSRVAAMVAKRRGEFTASRRQPGRKYKTPEVRRRVSPATVNRSATQPLREVILRAKNMWGVRTASVTWSEHMLPEPQERIREASPAEEAGVLEQLGRGYDTAVRFAFRSGCRRMEIVGLIWSRVNFFAREYTVIGKGSKERTIPMTEEDYQMFREELGRHPESVFTFEATRTRKNNHGQDFVRGQRYPVTEAGLKTAMRRAVPKSGVTNFRFHDTRHTAATRVLRRSNLRVVQTLLGHSDVKTTTKYAHALKEDVRAALEAASPTESPKTGTENSDKIQEIKGKSV
jgi:integrase